MFKEAKMAKMNSLVRWDFVKTSIYLRLFFTSLQLLLSLISYFFQLTILELLFDEPAINLQLCGYTRSLK
jgi:hypothetical protein